MAELIRGQKQQDLQLTNRKQLQLTGVMKVESFDSNQFILETSLGYLTIKGHGLHMKQLSLEHGEAHIEGLVHSLAYSDGTTAGKSGSWVGKLFK